MPEPKPEPKKTNRQLPEFVSLMLSALIEKAGKIIGRLGEFVIFRKILKKYAVMLAMMTAALITILYGLGAFIGSLFPNLKPGLVHIFIGIALAAVAMAYEKSRGKDD